MENKYIKGISAAEWLQKYPLLEDIINYREVCWINPDYDPENMVSSPDYEDLAEAERRWKRFRPYLKHAFPGTENGEVTSPLKKATELQNYLENGYDRYIKGDLYLKCDNELPIAGSIKARGGIYEVLYHAESLALNRGLLTINDDYSQLTEGRFKDFYSGYTLAVGSTGNLGLSIGIIGKSLGFKVEVHMSAEAREWKKKLLREKGVNVIEYNENYTGAVAEARRRAAEDTGIYFIDDENSTHLFLGYAVAAFEIADQLAGKNIVIDGEHPLFVYLPCGVGGGPGGITFGLKQLYGNNVHCFFAEPVHAPSMLIGLLTGLHDRITVEDFGIDGCTVADGLAVGRPSGFVGPSFGSLIAGVYTLQEEKFYDLMRALKAHENIFVEPSAAAGLSGPVMITGSSGGNFVEKIDDAIHIAWCTGGSLVPRKEKEKLLYGD